MRLIAYELINQPLTLNTTWNSSPIFIGHAVHFSAQLIFTGVPEGTWSIEYSNDVVEPPFLQPPTNWAVIVGSEQIIDEAGTHGWQVQNAGYRWVRITYTYSTSTGILTSATFHSKGG